MEVVLRYVSALLIFLMIFTLSYAEEDLEDLYEEEICDEDDELEPTKTISRGLQDADSLNSQSVVPSRCFLI